MAAAAIIFFAFYGFDAIATAAEEAKNPDRDLAIGIVGSMILCVIIYMAVAAVGDRRARLHPVRRQPRAAGADPARDRAGLGGQDPRRVGGDRACRPSSSPSSSGRAGSSSPWRATGCCRRTWRGYRQRGTPVRITLFTAIVVAVIAGLFPLAEIAALANAGTLAAFIAVCAAMLTMRRREPERAAQVHHTAAVGRRDRSGSSAASICSGACR